MPLSRQSWLAALMLALMALGVVLTVDDALAQAFTQPRTPFGAPGSEPGGQTASGLVGWILAKQAEFYRALSAAVRAAKADGRALWTLVGLGFAYGVLHAVGPGHGKAIIAAYVVANERALKRASAIALGAALLQGLVAIVIVSVVALLLAGTASMVRGTVAAIEMASFAAMAAFGLWLAWRKIGALRAMLAPKPVSAGAAAVPLAACDHFHLPGPDEAARWSIRDAWAAVFAAGLRPCAGAILVLAFALSQGILWIGIAAVFAMSLGTALATSGVAALAVFFKHVAVRLAAGRGRGGAIVVRLLEIAAALAVALLGLALLSGYWVAQGGA